MAHANVKHNKNNFKKVHLWPGNGVTCHNPSIWEVEARSSLGAKVSLSTEQLSGQPGRNRTALPI